MLVLVISFGNWEALDVGDNWGEVGILLSDGLNEISQWGVADQQTVPFDC